MLPKAVFDKHCAEFRYATHDCVQFVADAVEAMTGSRLDLPAYSNEIEARRLLASKSLLDRVAEKGERVPANEAQYGDVVVSSFASVGQIVGVADPPVFWVRGENQPIPVELNLAIGVYRCR